MRRNNIVPRIFSSCFQKNPLEAMYREKKISACATEWINQMKNSLTRNNITVTATENTRLNIQLH